MLSFWLALYLALSPIVRKVEIVGPVAPNDTTGHVDLMVGDTITLQAVASNKDGIITGRPVTWSSGNPTVASVTKAGHITAKQRGYATLTATIDGVKGQTRLCVDTTDQEELTATFSLHSALPGTAALYPSASILPRAVFDLDVKGPTRWGSCVHWWMSLTDKLHGVDLSKAGVATSNVSLVNIKAYIGKRLP